MKPIFQERMRRLIAQRIGAGTELNFTDRRTRQLSFTYGFSLIGGLMVIAYGWTYFFQHNPGHALVDFTFGFITLLNVLLLRRHRRLTIATGAILVFMLVLSGYLFTSGGLVGTGFLWIFTIPILAFFLEGAARGAVWMIAAVFEVAFINILQSAGLVATSYTSAEFTQILAGLITIGIMILLFELITERYESELQRQEHELEKFKRATDAATDGVVITDPQANIIYVNQAWERLTGYTFQEVAGKNPKLLQSGKTPRRVYTRMWKELSAGRSFSSEEFINRRKDGQEYAAEVQFFPVREGDHNLFYVEIQQNISDRKAIDRAKTEFVSLATHQLTTPLSAVSWFAELLLDGSAGKLTVKQKHLIERIEQSSDRMVGLVNALLNSSRIELGTFAIRPQPTNAGKLVKDVVDEIRVSYTAGPKVQATVQSKLPTINLDPNLFRIIVQNLVTNAARYTPPKGRVEIDFRRERTSVILTVRDTGIGIPPSEQEKIFTKLFRAANAQQFDPNGNGLGLYIVKAIVDAVGGTVALSSVEGQGTTFTVKLPMSGMPAKEGNRELSSAI